MQRHGAKALNLYQVLRVLPSSGYSMPEFYELQLILLTSFCLFALLLERYASTRKPAPKTHDFFQDGKAAPTPSTFASLAKKYLIVYAIVMGE
jgi:hypothetical protein